MPYGQFWDIRVSYGGAYDFEAANEDQMKHQLLKNAEIQEATGGSKQHVAVGTSHERVGDTDYTYETGNIPVAAEIYRASYVPITDIESGEAKFFPVITTIEPPVVGPLSGFTESTIGPLVYVNRSLGDCGLMPEPVFTWT